MNNSSSTARRPAIVAALLGLVVIALPLAASAGPLHGYDFTGTSQSVQYNNVSVAPGHVNNWVGAHNTSLGGNR